MAIGEGSGAPRRAWPSFLRGNDSREILARLGEGDPLRLRESAARRLRERWYLLDPDRVYHRALGICATAAPREEPAEDLTEWARAKVDKAIEQLVTADWEAERMHPETSTEEEMDFPLLTQSLMIEPSLVRNVSVAFNALEPLPRRAFFELLIEGRDLAACIEGGPWDEDGLYQAIQTALAPLGLDARADADDDPREGKQP